MARASCPAGPYHRWEDIEEEDGSITTECYGCGEPQTQERPEDSEPSDDYYEED